MANSDKPNGFIPVRHLTGGEIRTERRVLTASATVYPGDVLKVVAAGSVEAAATDAGIICGGVAAEYKVAAASGTTWVDVYVDPEIVYQVQADSGTALTVAAVNATANHVATTGSTTTKRSLQELDSSDVGTGANFKILGKVETPDNTWAEHVNLEVIFNEHLYKAAVAGV
jgi:enhancing lycopene biosynthesis protein 2